MEKGELNEEGKGGRVAKGRRKKPEIAGGERHGKDPFFKHKYKVKLVAEGGSEKRS